MGLVESNNLLKKLGRGFLCLIIIGLTMVIFNFWAAETPEFPGRSTSLCNIFLSAAVIWLCVWSSRMSDRIEYEKTAPPQQTTYRSYTATNKLSDEINRMPFSSQRAFQNKFGTRFRVDQYVKHYSAHEKTDLIGKIFDIFIDRKNAVNPIRYHVEFKVAGKKIVWLLNEEDLEAYANYRFNVRDLVEVRMQGQEPEIGRVIDRKSNNYGEKIYEVIGTRMMFYNEEVLHKFNGISDAETRRNQQKPLGRHDLNKCVLDMWVEVKIGENFRIGRLYSYNNEKKIAHIVFHMNQYQIDSGARKNNEAVACGYDEVYVLVDQNIVSLNAVLTEMVMKQ